MNAHIALVLLC